MLVKFGAMSCSVDAFRDGSRIQSFLPHLIPGSNQNSLAVRDMLADGYRVGAVHQA